MNAILKLKLIKEILTSGEKTYMHLMPHKGLIIGKRGLIGEEKEKGILLVFGQQSYKNLNISENFIVVDMRFSGKWETLHIPANSITTIFDSPVSPTFVFNFNIEKEDIFLDNKEKKAPVITKENEKVIKVDFKKD